MAAANQFAMLQGQIYSEAAGFPGGMLSLQLDKNFYEPGDQLIGMIYISTMMPFKCSEIQLDVESEERVEFTRFWTE